MSKLIVEDRSALVPVPFAIDPDAYYIYGWDVGDLVIIGSNRYTLDHEYALKQGDNHGTQKAL